MLEFGDIEAKYKVERANEFENVIFVDNIPVVNEQKAEKLKKLLTKLFKTVDIYLTFKGFCFVRFKTAEEATEALAMNQYKLDKSHTFKVKKFADIDKLLPIQNQGLGEFQKKDHLKYFLKDERARDQFAIIKQDEVQIFYNNKQDLPFLIQARQKWSDSKIKWSSQGTFLTTIHLQGIALWGGPNWEKQMRFAHENVQVIQFSPNEKYCVTVSTVPFTTDKGLLHNICVWDLVLGTLLRSFPLDDDVITGEDDESDCPLKVINHKAQTNLELYLLFSGLLMDNMWQE
jgi:translation initiation factor 3 subunit B